MPASADLLSAPTVFDRLRTELADLAFDLERQGRLDAADIVMQLDARLRELTGESTADDPLIGHCEESREARDAAIQSDGSPRPAMPTSR